MPQKIAFLSGLVFCILLVIAPDVLPAIVGQADHVWTPTNSAMYRFGDGYYYAAWVVELLQNGIPPGSPSAAEYADSNLLETLRWFPLAVAALPGLIFDDYRIVYVLDYVFTAAMFFGLPFWLCYRITGGVVGSLIAGILVLFCTGQWWGDIPVAIGSAGAPDAGRWISKLLTAPLTGSVRLLNMFEYEALQGSFRYINMSVSGPILMLYVALCHAVYRTEKLSPKIWLPLLIMSPLMAFSYPSHPLIAYAVLGGYAVMAYWRGHKKPAAALALIAVITAGGLLAGGYVSYVMSVFAENELWNNIFNNEKLELINRPWHELAIFVLINKYTLTFAISLLLAWKNRELRDMVLIIGGIACVLACCTVFDMPQLWGRFLGRGIDHLWFMTFIISCAYGFGRLSSTRFIKYPLLAAVIAVPMLSFGNYALESAHNLTRFMPASRWQALEWVDANVEKGRIIAALNWDDINFIPIYSHANLAIDNMIIGGRSPEAEFERYIAVWKILGLPRDVLKSRLENTIAATLKRTRSNRDNLFNPPLLTEEEYASAEIAECAIYWPYVKKLFDVPVASGSQSSAEFVEMAMQLYNNADIEVLMNKYDFSYVMLSGAEYGLEMKPALNMELVFENKGHQIYILSK